MSFVGYQLTNGQPICIDSNEVAAWAADHQVPHYTVVWLKGNSEAFIIERSFTDVSLDMLKETLPTKEKK